MISSGACRDIACGISHALAFLGRRESRIAREHNHGISRGVCDVMCMTDTDVRTRVRELSPSSFLFPS